MKNKVKELRKRLKLSQCELAERAQVGQSTISDLENNEHTPCLENAFSIAHALNTTVDKLFIYERVLIMEENEINEFFATIGLIEDKLSISLMLRFLQGIANIRELVSVNLEEES